MTGPLDDSALPADLQQSNMRRRSSADHILTKTSTQKSGIEPTTSQVQAAPVAAPKGATLSQGASGLSSMSSGGTTTSLAGGPSAAAVNPPGPEPKVDHGDAVVLVNRVLSNITVDQLFNTVWENPDFYNRFHALRKDTSTAAPSLARARPL